MSKKCPQGGSPMLCFDIGLFAFRICFEFRNSDFEFSVYHQHAGQPEAPLRVRV